MRLRALPRPQRIFELRVVPHQGVSYGLEIDERHGAAVEPIATVRIWGDPLKLLFDAVLSALREAGYRPSDLRATRKEPFLLDEEAGVRLGLLFRALKPMRKLARMEAVAAEVRAMSPEEVFYWWAKTASPHAAGRAGRALRVLLSREGR